MRVFALATVKTEAYPGLQGESSPLQSPVGGEAKEEEGKVGGGDELQRRKGGGGSSSPVESGAGSTWGCAGDVEF